MAWIQISFLATYPFLLYKLIFVTRILCFRLSVSLYPRVTGGELFEDIVAREYYSEADARSVQCTISLSDVLISRNLLYDYDVRSID